MNHTQFIFNPSLLAWLLGGSVVLLVILLAWLACRRDKWRTGTVWLESLRVFLAILAAFLLFQPELKHIETPPERGTLAILVDQTDSMKTEDVIDENGELISRKVWVEEFLEQRPWQALESRFNIEIHSIENQTDELRQEIGSNYEQALTRLTEIHQDLRAVVLIGDGDSNSGNSPVQAAGRLLQKQAVLQSVAVGSASHLPDLAFTHLDSPSFTIVDDPTQFPFRIRNSFDHEVQTNIELYENDTLVKTVPITLPPYTEINDSLYWQASTEGNFELTLCIPQHTNELLLDNNQRKINIFARPQSIRILVIETNPRWEYRYMRNAFSRDPGVEVNCLLFHPDPSMGMGNGPDYITSFPATLEELSTYDVIVLGDVPMDDRHLTEEQCQLIRDLVQKQASGLIFLPGSAGHIFTHENGPLGDLLPVTLDASSKEGFPSPTPANFTLTRAGENNLLTMLADDETENPQIWRNLPGFYWCAPVEKALGGSQVLAVHQELSNSYGRLPLIVARQAERGKVLFMATDGAWRWRRGVEDKYHYRFWGQVARWMSYQRQMAAGEYLRVYYQPEQPSPGDVVTLQANAFDLGGVPLSEGSVEIKLIKPDKSVQTWELEGPDELGQGSFAGQFRIEHRGDYKLIASCPENDDSVEIEFSVTGDPLEQIGQPIRSELLADISRITGGKMVPTTEITSVLAELNSLPKPTPKVKITRFWSNIWTLVILAGGFTVFWILRKVNGQF